MDRAPLFTTLYVEHIPTSKVYYVDGLDFQVIDESWNMVLGMRRDGAEIVLIDAKALGSEPGYDLPARGQRGRGVVIHIQVRDAASVFQKVKAKGLAIHIPLHDQEWGMRTFYLRDPDGYELCICSNI